MVLATELVPNIGYEPSAKIAKHAQVNGGSQRGGPFSGLCESSAV
jgi:fumarate hydratase class II